MRHSILLAGCILLSLLTYSASSLALGVNSPTTILSAGCQGTQCYLAPSANPDGCIYGVIYIVNDSYGKSMYATGLVAQVIGKSVRIDYTQDSSNKQCWASLVQVNK